jgi:hypothetical protein
MATYALETVEIVGKGGLKSEGLVIDRKATSTLADLLIRQREMALCSYTDSPGILPDHALFFECEDFLHRIATELLQDLLRMLTQHGCPLPERRSAFL